MINKSFLFPFNTMTTDTPYQMKQHEKRSMSTANSGSDSGTSSDSDDNTSIHTMFF